MKALVRISSYSILPAGTGQCFRQIIIKSHNTFLTVNMIIDYILPAASWRWSSLGADYDYSVSFCLWDVRDDRDVCLQCLHGVAAEGGGDVLVCGVWPQYSIPPYHLISSLQSDLGYNTGCDTTPSTTTGSCPSLSLSLSLSLQAHQVPVITRTCCCGTKTSMFQVWWWWGHRPTIGLSCGSLSYHWWQDRGCLVKMLGAMSYCLILYTYIIYIRS